MKSGILCILAAVILVPGVDAQEKQPPTYRLSFRLQESGAEGKATVRNYVLIVQGRSRGKINASRRLPYYTSSKGEAKELHTAALGSIIECTPEEKDPGVQLDCAFESSYVAPNQPREQPPIGFLPLINARQVSTTAFVAIGPEVQIVRLDDPSSNNKLEIFVSVERLSGPVCAAN
jgi:hypothetical protein